MRRLNEYTIVLEVGDPVPYGVGWAGSYSGPYRSNTHAERIPGEFWEKEWGGNGKGWNEDGGFITHYCYIQWSLHDEVNYPTKWFPQENEWGEISP